MHEFEETQKSVKSYFQAMTKNLKNSNSNFIGLKENISKRRVTKRFTKENRAI